MYDYTKNTNVGSMTFTVSANPCNHENWREAKVQFWIFSKPVYFCVDCESFLDRKPAGIICDSEIREV